MPKYSELIFPFASRPWRNGDVKPTAPYLDPEGYVDFKPEDDEDPRNWTLARKWWISLSVVVLVFNGTLASSVPAGCTGSLVDAFGVSETAVNLTVSVFVLGYCMGPFFFAPLSEFYGRRWMIYTTFLVYMGFNFVSAYAPNFATLLVSRLLAGIFISAPLCNSPGVLADLWDPFDRGNAMSLYAFAIWAGPSAGPIVASYLDEATDGWRWPFYFVLWIGAVSAAFMFTIPETHMPTILQAKAQRMRQVQIPGHEHTRSQSEAHNATLLEIYKMALTWPWLLLADPISFLCAVYLSIVFMLQYMLFSIYPIVFHQIKGWKDSTAQLPLLGAIVGAAIGAFVIFLNTRRRRRDDEQGKQLEPENNLVLAMIGGVGFPITMFWFAWSGQYGSIHWIVPTIAGTFLSASLMLIFVAFVNYLMECYSTYAASVMAANTFARSMGSGAAPLFTTFMFNALGVAGGGSLIGGVAVLLAVIPFVFHRYGSKIRQNSKYALHQVHVRHTEDRADEETPLITSP